MAQRVDERAYLRGVGNIGGKRPEFGVQHVGRQIEFCGDLRKVRAVDFIGPIAGHADESERLVRDDDGKDELAYARPAAAEKVGAPGFRQNFLLALYAAGKRFAIGLYALAERILMHVVRLQQVHVACKRRAEAAQRYLQLDRVRQIFYVVDGVAGRIVRVFHGTLRCRKSKFLPAFYDSIRQNGKKVNAFRKEACTASDMTERNPACRMCSAEVRKFRKIPPPARP